MPAERPGEATGSPSRRVVGFLGHQIAEYLLGATLIAVGFHLGTSRVAPEAVLISTGLALVLLGAATAGPLGALRLLSRRVHHVGDAVIIAGLACSPLAMLPHLDVLAVVLAEAVALLLVRIERGTSYRDAPRPARPTPGERPPSGLARQLGRTTSQAGAAAVALAPVAEKVARVSARRLGAATGAARRAGRAAAAERRRRRP